MNTDFFCALVLTLGQVLGGSQDPQEVQTRVGEVKKAIAENQARLKTYQWVETTELSLKGEVKKRDQKECRFGPDGKARCVDIGTPAEPKKPPRGLKGKVVEKKIDEFKDYMERFGSLLSRYLPPDGAQMQRVYQAGKAGLDRSSGGSLVSLVFSDYAKPGDKVTFTFDSAARKLRAFSVATYLDGPEDSVGVEANFANLPDGTNYVEQSVLTSKSKQLQIRKTNFDHKMLGQ